MKHQNKLINVVLLAAATYFLKSWLMDNNDESESEKKEKEKSSNEKKLHQLLKKMGV